LSHDSEVQDLQLVVQKLHYLHCANDREIF